MIIYRFLELMNSSVRWIYCCTLFFGGVIVLMIGYKVFIQPEIVQEQILREQQTSLERELTIKKQALKLARAKHLELSSKKSMLEALMKSLPNQKNRPAFLQVILNAGRATGLIVELFSPQLGLKHRSYTEQSIDLVVLGNYRQIVEFLNYLTKMEQLVTLHDFELLPSEPNGKNYLLMRMKLIIKVYWQS